MSDDDDWLDVNEYASAYEQRLNRRTGQWQHRPRQMQTVGMRRLLDEARVEPAWQDGRAPQ